MKNKKFREYLIIYLITYYYSLIICKLKSFFSLKQDNLAILAELKEFLGSTIYYYFVL